MGISFGWQEQGVGLTFGGTYYLYTKAYLGTISLVPAAWVAGRSRLSKPGRANQKKAAIGLWIPRPLKLQKKNGAFPNTPAGKAGAEKLERRHRPRDNNQLRPVLAVGAYPV